MNVRSETSGPPPRRRRGRPLVDDKRRRILDAALRVFAERGYHGTAVPEVAAAAKVGTGTLYRYFATKETLVNEVYRDAKARLRAALMDGLDFRAPGRGWFLDAWKRLIAFARAEPAAFRFLEMQDHAPYLDTKSREVELSVLAPLWLAGKALYRKRRPASVDVDVLIALVWGAFVGLVKADRLGYLRLDDATLMRAGELCWTLIDP
jgi:TetR/AcrR family transcriptional regulator, repressor of fatR-cypB operon